ncbi:hypothetical protein MUG87_11210 [Ectobacillus sp. JY-23]|uniref:hypothetical protein n=1 Tax=Ectobacillus sp. JY-23 TaxID=2933872 RepID=UPI001FF4D563|nr:hypothetical protein [Ectobacillus sp. JY-23]UOY91133.1 hypothetical protein MUG87_11210 [Ectobacillus sp. JY-23]
MHFTEQPFVIYSLYEQLEEIIFKKEDPTIALFLFSHVNPDRTCTLAMYNANWNSKTKEHTLASTYKLFHFANKEEMLRYIQIFKGRRWFTPITSGDNGRLQ